MAPYKLNKCLLVIFFLAVVVMAQGQEVLTSVKLERITPTQYRVRYQLNGSSQYELSGATLVIFRKRGNEVEEIFSQPLSAGLSLNNKSYIYNWKADTSTVKAGDLLQAKVILSYNKLSNTKASEKTVTNIPPRASAGSFIDEALPITKPIVLNGSGSFDSDGKIAAVEWKQIAGPTSVTIVKPDAAITEVQGDFKEGRYAFELKVADERGDTAIDRIIVTIRPEAEASRPAAADTIAKRETATVTPPSTTAPNNTTLTAGNAAVRKDTAATTSNKPVAATTVTKPLTSVTAPVTRTNMPALKGGPSNAFLNILVPGLGHYKVSGDQYGNDRKGLSFLITAFYAGSLGGATYYYLKSNDQYDKYVELSKFREQQHDTNGDVIGVRGANQAVAKQHLNDAKTSRRNALILAGVGGGIMITDLVYTFVKGSKNKKQWEREASGRANLFLSSDGSSVAAGFRLNF